MKKHLILLLVASLTIVGCGSTKKESSGEDSIEAKGMAFDPSGSDGGNIPGLKSINFDYDKATLSSDARRDLAANATWLNENAKVSIQIEGHCDSRGSSEYNLSLGERRANSVKSYLVSLGVDSQRLSVISYGEEKPLDASESEASWARNRRANFVPLAQ